MSNQAYALSITVRKPGALRVTFAGHRTVSRDDTRQEVVQLIPVVVAARAAGQAFVFSQPTPAQEWVINHNLGFRPSVELLSVGGAEIEGDVLHVSENQTLVSFVMPVAGSARLS